MNAGKAVYGILSTNTEVTDIVSTRIYPEIAEQEAPVPFIVYQVQNVAPEDTHDGPSTLDEIRFEFLCYDATYNGAAELGDKVRGALDRVQGTYNTVNVQSVQFNDVDTEIIDEPRRYAQVLTFTFRIARDNFTIAQGTPVTGAMLGDLYDVNTTGVTDGQVIAYDAATAVWLPATDAAGAEQLNDLSDVIISQPASGEFFRYDGDEWVNDTANKSDVGLGNVDNTSDANKPVSTATQTALDLKADITSVPTELDDLNDVQIIGTPTLGQALVYGAGKWLPGAAGATELGDLDDVNTTGAGVGSLLTYNGASWDISGSELPSDDVYFHQRYETESEALRTGATATTELYFTCTAQGNGLAESASSDTPTAGKTINRKIYYSEAGFADPDTGTWVEFTPAPADDATFATVKAALLEYLKARTGGTVPISLKQTWEETEPSTYLLDQAYGSGAAAAYSTRQLRLAQTDCMTIRRASDSTTTTIGFDGSGNINEAAISAFCTGTTCTVSEWKDQSGNGNHATQSTASQQPTIYTGGALVKIDGRAAMNLDGNTDGFNITSNIQGAYSIFTIGNPGGNDRYYQDSTFGSRQFIIRNSSVAGNFSKYQNGTATSYLYDFRKELVEFISNAPTILYTNTLLMRYTNSGAYLGDFSEYIIYTSDKSGTNQTSIQENIGDYFTQNTPLLDTYSGAAAAYSLRLLDSTYTGSAIRVRRSSDNTEQDIGFNVFSELDTVSLTAFAGTGDAFVKTWYDQSGNSNDATQTTTSNQPKIVSSGAVITENGKPAVEFVSQKLNLPLAVGVDFSVSWVWKSYNEANNQIPLNTKVDCYYNPGGPKNYRLYFGGALYQWTANESPSPILPSNQTAVWMNYSTSVSWYMRTNGVEKSFSSGASFTPATGEIGSFCNGVIQEMIIYNSNESANRTDIETNVNTFYSIF